MTMISVRDVNLFVEVVGQGPPLLIMHGGPGGADHASLSALRPCADQFTLIFYDHRCNGRSNGADLSSMTWDNLTADAEALREALGFEQWAVLGHSFGGMVALEYALRYPQSLSHLLLVDTCGDTRWVQEYAPKALAKRGYSPSTVEAARRFYNGELQPGDITRTMMKLGGAFYYRLTPWLLAREFLTGLRMKTQPETLIYGFGTLLKGWTVMDRLHEISAPTLVMAGRHDFQFPPEHQEMLAAGIPNTRLELIERAGHNATSERPAEVIQAIRDFLMASNA